MSLRATGARPRLDDALLATSAALLVVALVLASARSLVFGLGGMGLAFGLIALAIVGAQRLGVLAVAAAYFTAPFYKGIAFGQAQTITLTDLLLVGGFGLLLPTLVRGRVRLPALYPVGVGLVLSAGLGASVFSQKTSESFVNLGFWMIVMIALPLTIALWAPSGRQIDLLAGSFVAGQVFSLVLGLIQGNASRGRQAGLSTHPNYLAQGGLLALCLFLYLFYRYASRSVLATAVLLVAAAVCVASVLMSGSRAGTVAVAVLLLMVPLVERSAFTGFLVSASAALLLLSLPVLARVSGEGSVLARLGGDTSAENSNTARSLGLETGVQRFLEHPLRGMGVVDLFEIHNNFVEVAVAIGVFGLAGYVLVLVTFAKPLFGSGEFRRLGYAAWAYIGFGATVPSLYDRSVWAVVALSIVAVVRSPPDSTPTPPTAADTTNSSNRLLGGRHPARLPVSAERPPHFPAPLSS